MDVEGTLLGCRFWGEERSLEVGRLADLDDLGVELYVDGLVLFTCADFI